MAPGGRNGAVSCVPRQARSPLPMLCKGTNINMEGFLYRGMASRFDGASSRPPSQTPQTPPSFGGSVLGGSDSPPPGSSAPVQRPKRKELSASALRGMGVGGLDDQLEDLFRRAFASRLVPASVAAQMGMGHVKGVLLYGPPGTGKTLVARKIAKLLANNREPEIVNGPELLTRWVGQSEANIRGLFERAEKAYQQQGDNAELHVVIFDEIDALCKARGSGGGEGSGHAGVGESVVNQLLTKMDGLDSAPNVLIIGMTNRRDLLDEALLRPGRFEVQMEVALPNVAGRRQILEIHTQTMRENDMLATDIDLQQLVEGTRNFSGAELAGLVRLWWKCFPPQPCPQRSYRMTNVLSMYFPVIIHGQYA